WRAMVLSHYQQFMEEKSNVANDDVYLLFSPPWLSAYERALLWIGDYKPSLIHRLVDGAVKGLTAEQRGRVERTRDKTKRAERELTEAVASVQESMANNGAGAALEGLGKALEKVLERADELRALAMRKVVGILSPPRTVALLAATMHFQMRVRMWGLQRAEVGRSRR
uniref:DOG1 domain-containing protein n=1 Tax=Glycine max TaxID=3847 RepID=K7KU33_SOYBN